jgi:hypothetical protein
MWSTYGTYAQFVSAAESTLQPIPAGLSYQEAAAVPLAAMTAWQAMQPSMPLQGKRVLVHAGAGGVGHFAIQIAKAQGAFVATTCSARNAEFVRKLGADRPIDYTQERCVGWWLGAQGARVLSQLPCTTTQPHNNTQPPPAHTGLKTRSRARLMTWWWTRSAATTSPAGEHVSGTHAMALQALARTGCVLSCNA